MNSRNRPLENAGQPQRSARSAQAPTGSRLLTVDQNLKSLHGHYLSYAQRLGRAASELGVKPIIAGNRQLVSSSDTSEVIPALHYSYWQELRPAKGTDPVLHLVSRAGEVAATLAELESKLRISGEDVVFFPYANLIHAWALARIHRNCKVTEIPRSVLLFRRDLSEHGIDAALGSRQGILLLRQALAELVTAPGGCRVRFFTDSEYLTDEYSDALRQQFQTVPIPVDSGFAAPKTRMRERPLRLLYLGDARTEKGYQLLPHMASALRERLRNGELELVIQSNFNLPGGEPGIPAARSQLAELPGVRLLEDPISEQEYIHWMQTSHLVLLPYRAECYVSRTSGILAEAIHSAVPAVVPEGTWLSDQLRSHGAGRTFTSGRADDLVEAVTEIIADYERFAAAAFSRRSRFMSFHTPARLAQFVCGADILSRAAASTQEDS